MENRSHGKRRNLGWLLLLVALVLVWWFWRPSKDRSAAESAVDPAEVADLGALSDPDDILVDLRDDIPAADVEALE